MLPSLRATIESVSWMSQRKRKHSCAIEFGLFRSKPNIEHKVEHVTKKQRDLSLTSENTDFEAEEPDDDAWGDYPHKSKLCLADVGGADDQNRQPGKAAQAGAARWAMQAGRASLAAWLG